MILIYTTSLKLRFTASNFLTYWIHSSLSWQCFHQDKFVRVSGERKLRSTTSKKCGLKFSQILAHFLRVKKKKPSVATHFSLSTSNASESLKTCGRHHNILIVSLSCMHVFGFSNQLFVMCNHLSASAKVLCDGVFQRRQR